MKLFSMTPCMVSCATAVALLLASSSTMANHNSPASLKARVAAVGTLQITGVANANNADDTAAEDGETVYNTTCATCHASGIAGAPVLGKVDDWTDRIEQGIDALTEHAILGFSGSSGVMPAKGGNPAISDDAITAAVQFMVDQVE